jgi:phospholipid/cholesterol/gamma-HCH transport system ATP-binding protein
MADPVIQLRNLHKSFGEKVIYRGLDLEVERGELHAIIGRSGEGKSVLLKQITGLLAPDSGEVLVEGRHVRAGDKASMAWVRQRVTMVFQMGALFDSLTVRQNVGFYLDWHKTRPAAEVDEVCSELLAQVNLPETGHLLPSELSGGMRKRVGLARALAASPEIILYDEPTTGLDPVTTDVIGDLILKTQRTHGITSIVVTHDMKSAYKMADRISMLYEGRIIFTGTVAEIQACEDPVIHQFIEGEARGPITATEDEHVHQLSSEMVNRSLLIRKLHKDD